MWKMPRDQGLAARANRIAEGDESPSPGVETYHFDGIARVGDEHVDSRTVQIARYVREHTKAYEPIWLVISYNDGGEIYFLADRVDATPYDVWDEVVTRHDVERLLHALRTNPPKLIIGQSYDYTPETAAYVEAHWKPVETIDGVPIRLYDPSSV
jgi:hypothetical protein